MKRLLVLSILFSPSMVWAVPDSTMSITPACTAGTTITCSDNTTRMNNISTPYNAHTHNDLTITTSNTFTVGNGSSGSKSYVIDNQFTTGPLIRYNDTLERWQILPDGSTVAAEVLPNIVRVGDGTAANNPRYQISTNFTTNPSIRYNTVSEVWQFSNNASTFVNMTGGSVELSFNRTAAAGSGVQAVTGAGFRPQNGVFFCNDNAGGPQGSWGQADSGVLYGETHQNSTGSVGDSASLLVNIDAGGGNIMQATLLSWDAAGFSLTWTRAGTGVQVNCKALVWR